MIDEHRLQADGRRRERQRRLSGRVDRDPRRRDLRERARDLSARPSRLRARDRVGRRLRRRAKRSASGCAGCGSPSRRWRDR